MKKLKILVASALMMVLVVGLATAKDKVKTGPVKSKAAHLFLYEKDPSTQQIISGSWGMMAYNLAGPTFNFVFNGVDLPEGKYSLIYYKENPLPIKPAEVVCLARGIANKDGLLYLAGSYNFDYDLKHAKILLVLSADVNCKANKMLVWNPTAYLFGTNDIFYKDTKVDDDDDDDGDDDDGDDDDDDDKDDDDDDDKDDDDDD